MRQEQAYIFLNDSAFVDRQVFSHLKTKAVRAAPLLLFSIFTHQQHMAITPFDERV